jgi:hypothetical protein
LSSQSLVAVLKPLTDQIGAHEQSAQYLYGVSNQQLMSSLQRRARFSIGVTILRTSIREDGYHLCFSIV